MNTRVAQLLVPVLSAAVVGIAFMSIFLLAFKAPTPHHVRIAVTDTVPVQLKKAVGDTVTWVDVDNSSDGIEKLCHRDVFAAIDVKDGRLAVDIAGANGPAVNSAIGTIAQRLGNGAHLQVSTKDIRPASKNDARGMAAFYAAFGTIMTGFVFAGNSHGLAPKHRRRTRVLSAVAVGVLTGIGAAILVGPVLAVLPASVSVLASYFALLATSSSLTCLAALEALGPPGAMFSSIVLLAAGNASSSAILPLPLMGPAFTWLSEILPTGPVVRALIGAAYFDNADRVLGIVVPSLWGLTALGVILASGLLAKGRNSPSNRKRESGATSHCHNHLT